MTAGPGRNRQPRSTSTDDRGRRCSEPVLTNWFWGAAAFLLHETQFTVSLAHDIDILTAVNGGLDAELTPPP